MQMNLVISSLIQIGLILSRRVALFLASKIKLDGYVRELISVLPLALSTSSSYSVLIVLYILFE